MGEKSFSIFWYFKGLDCIFFEKFKQKYKVLDENTVF